MDSKLSETCSVLTEWGQCRQPGFLVAVNESGINADPVCLCSAHSKWWVRGITPDRYYERKVALGLTTPTWDWMSDEEADALLNGRYRGDGRRLDAWVSGEPTGWVPS